MMATWYGPGFEGSTTASGEPFDPNDYTAAHKTLPFGTKLVVTYNGRSVVVRVNDRGPYSGGYDLDLSQAAAEYLGLTAVGAAAVDVEFADSSTPTGPYSGSGAVRQSAPPAGQAEPQPAAQQPQREGSGSGTAALDQYAEGGGDRQPAAAPEQYREEQPVADRREEQAAAPEQYDDGEEPSPGPVPGVSLKGALQDIAEDPAEAQNWIELAEAAAPLPEAEPTPAGEPRQEAAGEADPAAGGGSTLGISVLPDTGGAPAAVLAGTAALILAGLVVGRGIFRR